MTTLLTTQQAATRLALSAKTVSKMARAGTLPCVRINCRVVRFSEEGLQRWADKKERK